MNNYNFKSYMPINHSILMNLSTLSIDINSNSSHLMPTDDPYAFSPNLFEWCLLMFAMIIFTIGIVGNLLVVIVVVKNAHMRTITNIFIVNLAIGDFFVILICLPPSIINDISGNWWFGKTMCKIIPYVQYISVCISVMTLTSISYERYYAIVYPLKFQATKFRAKIILLIIWILAILINLPHPIVITMKKESNVVYCFPTWNKIYQNIFDLLIFMILYILPMALIFYTYTRVVKVLWKIDKSIAWDETDYKTNTTTSINNSTSRSKTYTFPRTNSHSPNCQITYTMASGSSMAKSKMKNQLIARRKAAKMLISVAIMFAICYLPIHLLNILRFTGSNLLENALGDYAIIIFQIAHCLVYLNSCVNPLIYNFMSDNFRKEFRKILFCKLLKNHTQDGQSEIQIKNLNGSHVFSNNNNNNTINRSINTFNKPASNYTFVSNLNQTSFKSNISKVLTNSQNSILKPNKLNFNDMRINSYKNDKIMSNMETSPNNDEKFFNKKKSLDDISKN